MADAKVNTKLKNRKKSALKAARVAARRRVINLRRSRAMKDVVKEAMQLVTGKKGSEAALLMPKVYQAVDKAVKGGVIKLNTAARIKSRLSKRIKAIA
jgi:small subunit ribosomal protein S20